VRRSTSVTILGLGAALFGLGCAAHPHLTHLTPAASEAKSAPLLFAIEAGASLVPARSRPALKLDPDRYLVPEDAVVRLVGPQMSCSGTLVDEDLVLTAVHCVVRRGPNGEYTRELVAPGDLDVQLGGDYLPWGHVGVSSIVSLAAADDGKPCGQRDGQNDLVILILPRKLVGLGVMPPREAPAMVGEALEPIGFGRCALSPDGIHRQQRSDAKVEWVSTDTFEMRASICPGDSGGPVHARGSPEVVGVVSQSAMDGDERTSGRSVMVRVDAYRGLFSRARQIADGTPASELPPVTCYR
jgi:hypothetical protein